MEKNVIGHSSLFQGGKTVVPKVVRELLKLNDGDKIQYVLVDGKIFLEKAPSLVKRVGKYL